METGRDLLWLVAAAVFGTLVLPFLTYQTGVLTLGPYVHGGAGAFFNDFLGHLAGLRWPAWLLALGPVAIVAVWRILRRVFRPTAQKGG